MASKATREAMGLGALASFAQEFVKAKQAKAASKKEEERFAQELAAKRLELEKADAYKRAAFQLDQLQEANRLAGMGAQTVINDPVTGKQYFQAPKMKPEDVRAAQEQVLGISLPGLAPATAPVVEAYRRPQPPPELVPMGQFPPRPGTGVGQPKIDGKSGPDKAQAQGRVTGLLTELEGLYNQLDKMKAIVSTERGTSENISASAGASPLGQTVGRVTGSEAQSVRNKIAQMKPLLIQEIRKATEMGARGLDSEKELEFYLKAATDPTVDISTNLNALRILDNAYGLGGKFSGKAPAAKEDAEKFIQDMESKGFKFKGVK